MIAGFAAAEAWLSGDPRRTLAALGELNRPDEQNDEIRALSMLDEGEARLRLGELAAAGSARCTAPWCSPSAPAWRRRRCARRPSCRSWKRPAAGSGPSARLGRQALVTADRFGITDATDLGWVRMALASVYGEWDRIAEADRLLDEGLDLAAGDPDLLVAIATVRAKLRHGSGRLAAALEVLHTARRELGGARARPERRAGPGADRGRAADQRRRPRRGAAARRDRRRPGRVPGLGRLRRRVGGAGRGQGRGRRVDGRSSTRPRRWTRR